MRKTALFFTLLLLLTSLSFSQVTRLRPAQRIRISCPEAGISCERTIVANGTITCPGLGRLLVGGMELQTLAKFIREQLRIRNGVRANVTVSLVDDPCQPIMIFGPLTYTGPYPWREGLQLSDLIIDCAPQALADTSSVEVYDVTGHRHVFDIGEKPVLIKPGDRIVVPRSKTANEIIVVGGVMKPGSYPFLRGMRIQEVLKQAGGFHPHGDPSRIVLERDGLGQAGEPNFELRRGDIVRVPLVPSPRWISVEGAVAKPGNCPHREGMTLLQMIPFVGQILPEANLDKIVIRPLKGKPLVYSLNRIQTGQEIDPVVPVGAVLRFEFAK